MNTNNEIQTFTGPREKLIRHGISSLSDEELLALLLRTGTIEADVFTLSRRLLPIIDSANAQPNLDELCKISGVGRAKAATICAALEFSRRRIRSEGQKIRTPQDLLPMLQHLTNRPQEHLIVVTLNGAHEVIATRVVTIGLVNMTHVHPREVFAEAIADRACAIILAHNHPSGNVQPSNEDLETTKRLRSAGETLGIQVIDHIIFSSKGYYSFQAHGFL